MRTFKNGLIFDQESIDLAPCRLGKGLGCAFTLKADKSGICVCPAHICEINGRNEVLNRHRQGTNHPFQHLAGEDGIVTHDDVESVQLNLWVEQH